jgi:hypothetical protein
LWTGGLIELIDPLLLAALALGGFFFVPGVKGTLFASFSAIMSTTVFSGVASFLAPVGACLAHFKRVHQPLLLLWTPPVSLASRWRCCRRCRVRHFAPADTLC